MSLDPADPVWPSLVKGHLLLVWIAAAGLPLAYAALRNRPASAWLLYGPAVGVAAHLLAVNLVSWVFPGAPGAWAGFGLVAALVLGTAWRGGFLAALRRAPAAGLAAAVLIAAALYAFLLANRTQTLFVDEAWRLPVASILAAGSFPPVAAYTPEIGIGYHYGADLLAASLMNLAGLPSWSAFTLVNPFVLTVMALAVAGLARDLGVSWAVASGVAVMAVFADRLIVLGLPQTLSVATEGPFGFLSSLTRPLDAHPTERVATTLLNSPHFSLAITLAVLVAAALRCEGQRRAYPLLSAAAGLAPLAETSTFLALWLGLAVCALFQLWRLHTRARIEFAAAVLAGALIAGLAGGAVSDALFGRGGSTGVVSLQLQATPALYAPITATSGPFSVAPGLALLLLVGAIGTWRLRSWALGFLTLVSAAAFGLYQILTVGELGSDARLLGVTTALASMTAMAAIGAWTARAARAPRVMVAVALLALVVLPSALPRMVSGSQLAGQGIDLSYPRVRDKIHRHYNSTVVAGSLRADWMVYDWMRRSLPREARVLSPAPPTLVAATGRVAPTSTRDLAVFDYVLTHTYYDALNFLSRDDLSALGVTHLHVTSESLASMEPSGRRALTQPQRFRLIHETSDELGKTHWVYAVTPGAGQPEVEPGSYARLRDLVLDAGSVLISGAVPEDQRLVLLLALSGRARMFGPTTTFLARSSKRPAFEVPAEAGLPPMVVLPAWVVPTTLGLYLEDRVWSGYGLNAYRTEGAWTPVWRIGPSPVEPPARAAVACQQNGAAGLQLRVLGDPGSAIAVGESTMRLAGTPQVLPLSSRQCANLRVSLADSPVQPFVQVRALPDEEPSPQTWSAGLGFDGGTDAAMAVINIWYRNPQAVQFADGTELRLYPADAAVPGPAVTNPADSLAWWAGPVVLSVETQMAALHFDARALEVNGVSPSRSNVSLPDGGYVLALTLAGLPEGAGELRIRAVIPLVSIVIASGQPTYVPYSGIVGLDP